MFAYGVVGRGGGRRGGFTIVELLVVVAIIAILMSLLIPVPSKARDAARATACAANCRTLDMVFQNYISEFGQCWPYNTGNVNAFWILMMQQGNYTDASHGNNTADTIVKARLCPSASTPNPSTGNQWGSFDRAWGPNNPGVLGGYLTGSYGFNGWLYSTKDSRGSVTQYWKMPASQDNSRIPVFGDCLWVDATPWGDDQQPSPGYLPASTSSETPRTDDAMVRFCISRHGRAVNMAFLDGHAELVPLGRLWVLDWGNGYCYGSPPGPYPSGPPGPISYP